jgi:hypothetical protein
MLVYVFVFVILLLILAIHSRGPTPSNDSCRLLAELPVYNGRADIPHLIHVFNAAGTPSSILIATYAKIYPGDDVVIWTKKTVATAIGTEADWFLPLFLDANDVQETVYLSGIFIIYFYGGVFVDTSTKPLFPVWPYLDPTRISIVETTEGVRLLAASKRHPSWRLVFSEILASKSLFPRRMRGTFFMPALFQSDMVHFHVLPCALFAYHPKTSWGWTFECGKDDKCALSMS